MKNIFTPYVNENNSKQAVGLGLSVINNIVMEKLSGEINFIEVNQGVKFIILIPLEIKDEQ